MVENLLEDVLRWVAGRPDIRAIALVGSHARGTARPDSDVDLLLLAERPHDLVKDTSWLAAFGRVDRCAVESWGRVTSVRAWYAGGPEVEFGLTSMEWLLRPDEGTRRVLADGFRVLLDRDGAFARLGET